MAGQKPLSINEDKDVRKVKRNIEKLFNDFLCYGVNRKVLSLLNKINDDLPDDKDSVGIKIALFKLLELKALIIRNMPFGCGMNVSCLAACMKRW